MKKYYSILILAIVLLSVGTTSYAGSMKIIKLKDGSVLKGNVLRLSSGVYTFETSNLGEVDIEESDILSITSPELSGSLSGNSSTLNNMKSEDLKKQVQQIQGSILADEGIMLEIQDMLKDENIRAMLSDPKLMEDVTSFDPQKIQQNTSVQELMNNPKIQELMQKIQQKMPGQ